MMRFPSADVVASGEMVCHLKNLHTSMRRATMALHEDRRIAKRKSKGTAVQATSSDSEDTLSEGTTSKAPVAEVAPPMDSTEASSYMTPPPVAEVAPPMVSTAASSEVTPPPGAEVAPPMVSTAASSEVTPKATGRDEAVGAAGVSQTKRKRVADIPLAASKRLRAQLEKWRPSAGLPWLPPGDHAFTFDAPKTIEEADPERMPGFGEILPGKSNVRVCHLYGGCRKETRWRTQNAKTLKGDVYYYMGSSIEVRSSRDVKYYLEWARATRELLEPASPGCSVEPTK